MNRIFTPWRMTYLSTPRSDQGCIFCQAAEAAPSADSLVLRRTGRIVVMLNRYPYSNAHLMIAPLDHRANLYDSNRTALGELIMESAAAQKILSDVYSPDGFNLGMNFGTVAGAGFADHYHVHLVPRWGGDHNFMSVTADTRMIPEDLADTWARLAPKFAATESSF